MTKIGVKIAELIGMHIGDGTLYRTSRGLVWELRGNLNEKEYYDNNVTSLLLSIFKEEFKAKFRTGGKNGCIKLNLKTRNIYINIRIFRRQVIYYLAPGWHNLVLR